MVVVKHDGDLLPERRGLNSPRRTDRGFRVVRRGRRFARFPKPSLVLLLSALFLISISVFGLRLHLPGHLEKLDSGDSISIKLDVADNGESTRSSILSTDEVNQEFSGSNNLTKSPKSKQRKRHNPCEVGFVDSVDYLREPQDIRNFTQFSLQYVVAEEKPLGANLIQPRFGGHQTLHEREKSFHARNQTLHCGFVKASPGFPSTGFDLDEKDKAYMKTCQVVVSSCIFGSSDFLRRPTSKRISELSKRIVCFVMFVDEQTQSKLFSDGNIPDDRGYVGLWRIVVVKNLPYQDMRRTGKVPKFLSHRLFPSSRYSIWLDSKMRLTTDPLLIIEYFLWRTRSEYAISNHYDRHCVWEEVLQNKRLNKYNHTAIDEQFNFYQLDGLRKFDPSDPNTPLPSFVPEGSFIIRAHTPMSNLFSCLWFNEVDRFTSRDQLSFAYTYLKLRRLNPHQPLYLNMFKDCERRALAKLFRHRTLLTPPGP